MIAINKNYFIFPKLEIKHTTKIVVINMKFGISSLVFLPESLTSSIEKIAEHNFDAWEIVCEGTHYLSPKNIKYLMELRDRYEVEIIVHAPFSDLNPASMNERVRRLTVECIRDAIEGAFELDSEIVVVHPGYIPELWSNYVNDILDNNFSTLSEIVEIAEDYGIKIGLENAKALFMENIGKEIELQHQEIVVALEKAINEKKNNEEKTLKNKEILRNTIMQIFELSEKIKINSGV